tara:strand:+ start:287 stop:439 length:153 start_codon:yes stop_codon:yes gene_type:complete
MVTGSAALANGIKAKRQSEGGESGIVFFKGQSFAKWTGCVNEGTFFFPLI